MRKLIIYTIFTGPDVSSQAQQQCNSKLSLFLFSLVSGSVNVGDPESAYLSVKLPKAFLSAQLSYFISNKLTRHNRSKWLKCYQMVAEMTQMSKEPNQTRDKILAIFSAALHLCI